MKKLILILLLIPIVSAYELSNDNYKMSVGILSGENLTNDNYKLDVNMYPAQSKLENNNYKLDFGYLTNWLVPEPTAEIESGGGTLVEPTKERIVIITPYYDIILDNVKPSYYSNGIIYPLITIINKGDTPDRDAILTYYLSSPNNKTMGESREIFEEVPPTCPDAIYNRYEHICEKEDGTTSEPLTTVLEREIALPSNTIKGEWRFYVTYETEVQPLIEVYKSFRVVSVAPLIILILVIYIIISEGKPARVIKDKMKEIFRWR